MSEPLERLAEDTKSADRRNGGFSRRLGEIVERYDIIGQLTKLPEFTEIETQILSEVICGSIIDTRKIRGLHLDVLDASIGNINERKALAEKIKSLQAAQRLKIIEELGQ
ncbi:hypothetical protein [Pectinatus frisingensis]|nr:hypothetical protein [Pectinatus frisingensis]